MRAGRYAIAERRRAIFKRGERVESKIYYYLISPII